MNHLTKREKEILAVLKKEPLMPQDELAERIKISRSAAAVHISNLMRKGYIVGKGYIFDERSGILVIGRTWLEICADANGRSQDASGSDLGQAVSGPGQSRSASGSDLRRSGSGRIDCSYRGDGYLLATELARYRLEPTLLTHLGKDELGDRICDHLLQRGVNTQRTICSASVPTGKRLVLTYSGRVQRRIEDEGSMMDVLDQDAVAAREDLIRNTRVLLIDGSLPQDTMRFLSKKAASYNIMCSVVNCDLGRLKEYGYLSYPQFYLVCRAGEIAAQAGIVRYQEPEELFPACRKIVSEGCFAVVVLYDDQGLILAANEEMAYLPAPPLQTPGSVISVAAGIAEGLVSGYRLRLAVRKAMGSPVAG